MDKHIKNTAQYIARLIEEKGGRAFLVGGCVRDFCINRESKDFDMEVYGLCEESLLTILHQWGPVDLVGRTFGVYKVHGLPMDFAFPRLEKKTQNGHRGFTVKVDPTLPMKEASRRRDFTINAMLMDPLTGEILDFYGGREDLRQGILRCVDEKTFPEDSLRVLRAAQFAARFHFTVEEKTRDLCRRISLQDLPGERVLEEVKKALLQAEKPSLFFGELHRMNQLHPWFTEMENLQHVPQRPDAHPEGDVWAHTMLVLDEAARLRTRAHQPLALMLAACAHDFGKPLVTKEQGGKITSYGHEHAGLEPARAWMQRLRVANHTQNRVLSMVENHMKPGAMYTFSARVSRTNLFLDRQPDFEDLLLLSQADFMGCGAIRDYAPLEHFWVQRIKQYRDILMQNPPITGQELCQMGMKPGPQMGVRLQEARKQILCGQSRQSILRQIQVEVDKAKRSVERNK